MKHFWGGFLLGLILAIRYIPGDHQKRGISNGAAFLAHMIAGCFGGIITWCLLP